MNILTSTEFCITCLIMAAAVVAYLCIPGRRGAAREFTFAGDLVTGEGDGSEPSIRVDCTDNGTVMLTRTGLHGLTDADAVSIAVTVIGFDIMIEERVSRGRAVGWPVESVKFALDFMGREHYHLRYNSSETSSAASLTVNNRPGFNAVRPLRH